MMFRSVCIKQKKSDSGGENRYESSGNKLFYIINFYRVIFIKKKL